MRPAILRIPQRDHHVTCMRATTTGLKSISADLHAIMVSLEEPALFNRSPHLHSPHSSPHLPPSHSDFSLAQCQNLQRQPLPKRSTIMKSSPRHPLISVSS